MKRGFPLKSFKIVAFTMFFMFFYLLSSAQGAEGMGYTEYFGDEILNEILSITISHNAGIFAAVEKVNQSRAEIRSTAAALGPSLSASWTGQYSRHPDEYKAALNLIQTLYSGGTLKANKKAAEFTLSATRAESTKTYQDVVNTARISYYECLRALAQVQVAEEAVALAKEHLKQAEALYNKGIAPKGDILRVKVSVTQGELDLISARSNFDVRWVALEHAVGTKLSKEKIMKPLSGEETDALQPPIYQLPGDVAGKAVSQRAEIKAYEYYGKRAEQLIKSAKGGRKPKVTLNGRLNGDIDSDSRSEDSWYIQLEAQWLLYDGGALKAQIERAKAAARELLYLMENLLSQVRQEAIQSEIQVLSARERLLLAAEQAATSKEDYGIALRRYGARLGTNLDVLDARRALIQSRTEYINAIYDIAVAQSGLVYAMGDDLPPENLFHGALK